VAQRISQRLAEDVEVPTLSISVGVVEYPRDGSTIESLLSKADRALYEAKRHSPSAATLPSIGAVADALS
jgi:diguanylate cyclase (GGDEF)-like protein